jgi:hypothetical protein
MPEDLMGTTESDFLLLVLELFEEDHRLELLCCLPSQSHLETPRRERLAGRSCFHAIVRNIFKRGLFITSNGGLGIAQDSILGGDLICILFGCSIPVVLREADGHYILISDACVSGYMYGKGIEELEQGRLGSEHFEIH